MREDKSPQETDIVPMDIPRMDIETLKSLTAFVAEVKKELMTEGRDYVVKGGKQYTSRSGFAKLAQGFNLSDEILKEEEIVRAGDFYGFNFTIRVYNSLGRQATGVGSCTVDEPNIQKSHQERPYHDCRSIAYTRAWNRAVSNFVGSAEVSAEEMSMDNDGSRREVESEQSESFLLPTTFVIPDWDVAEALRAEGWGNLETIFETFIGGSTLDPKMFKLEAEDLRAVVKCVPFLGDSFGDIAKLLKGAGFTWRPKEKRFVLMKPEDVS